MVAQLHSFTISYKLIYGIKKLSENSLNEARKANKSPISNYIKKIDEIFLMYYVRFNQITTSITYNNKKKKKLRWQSNHIVYVTQ
jgi:flagellar capping protein FliD